MEGVGVKLSFGRKILNSTSILKDRMNNEYRTL